MGNQGNTAAFKPGLWQPLRLMLICSSRLCTCTWPAARLPGHAQVRELSCSFICHRPSLRYADKAHLE